MSNWFSNWCIYMDNLSFFYLFSVVVSFAAVLISWWIYKTDKTLPLDNTKELQEPVKQENIIGDGSLMAQYKKARQNAVEQRILSNFTEEQLEEERQAEKEQLAAIFQLLSQQQEKFQVNSMEELENQLRLYRS